MTKFDAELIVLWVGKMNGDTMSSDSSSSVGINMREESMVKL